MSEEDIYKKAFAKWGIDTQVIMAMGECGELIAELNAFFNQGKSSRAAVIDEIADVEIMCAQLRQVFSDEEVDARKQYKLERLEGILNGTVEHPHG